VADSKGSAEALSGSTAGTEPAKGSSSKSSKTVAKRRWENPFTRLGRFAREVVAELRKVIYPTRNELVTYTVVVIVFVAIMVTVVGLLDLGFTKAVLYVFGNDHPKK
jgi:preprotein translocase subunit SecE